MSATTSLRAAPVSPDWDELRARLRSFVAARVRDESAIHDDLVQEILLRLHRALPRLNQEDRLDAFAYQVARNAIADHYRRDRREVPVPPESIDEHPVRHDDESGEAARSGRAELARCLRPFVERLGKDHREALLLTDLGDLSQAEAARRLGLSAPGMRSRVQRGRAQLHEALAQCCRVELDAAAQIDHVDRIGPCALSADQ